MWKPSSSEISLIRDWLLNYSLTTVENKLACIILEGLNWGFGEHVGIENRSLEPPPDFFREKVQLNLGVEQNLKTVNCMLLYYGCTPNGTKLEFHNNFTTLWLRNVACAAFL